MNDIERFETTFEECFQSEIVKGNVYCRGQQFSQFQNQARVMPISDHCQRSCPFWLRLTQKLEEGSNILSGLEVDVLEYQFDGNERSLEPGKSSLCCDSLGPNSQMYVELL